MKPFTITDPVFIVFKEQPETDDLVVHVYPPEGWDRNKYGRAICNIVRIAAEALNCSEEDLWEGVEQERDNPTTEPVQFS